MSLPPDMPKSWSNFPFFLPLNGLSQSSPSLWAWTQTTCIVGWMMLMVLLISVTLFRLSPQTHQRLSHCCLVVFILKTHSAHAHCCLCVSLICLPETSGTKCAGLKATEKKGDTNRLAAQRLQLEEGGEGGGGGGCRGLKKHAAETQPFKYLNLK